MRGVCRVGLALDQRVERLAAAVGGHLLGDQSGSADRRGWPRRRSELTASSIFTSIACAGVLASPKRSLSAIFFASSSALVCSFFALASPRALIVAQRAVAKPSTLRRSRCACSAAARDRVVVPRRSGKRLDLGLRLVLGLGVGERLRRSARSSTLIDAAVGQRLQRLQLRLDRRQHHRVLAVARLHRPWRRRALAPRIGERLSPLPCRRSCRERLCRPLSADAGAAHELRRRLGGERQLPRRWRHAAQRGERQSSCRRRRSGLAAAACAATLAAEVVWPPFSPRRGRRAPRTARERGAQAWRVVGGEADRGGRLLQQLPDRRASCGATWPAAAWAASAASLLVGGSALGVVGSDASAPRRGSPWRASRHRPGPCCRR